MIKKVRMSLKENAYDIVIGNNILSKLGIHLKRLKIGQDAIIITNPIIKKYYASAIVKGLKENGLSVKIFEVPSGEKSKSARYAHELLEKIASYDALKKVFIIALGGGVVGDLAGYVAAVYKRGVPYVQVPTTLLAQVDSSIGGKVAIDLTVGKNLVGAFYQPKVVWSDISVLATLDHRQLINGFSEAVKYGIIYDKKLFCYIFKNYKKLLSLDVPILKKVVLSCSRIKAEVVAEDEKETKGIRTILNFGHTIGHAVEAAAGYNAYHHGEAVALGMRIACDISYQSGLLSKETLVSINQLLSLLGLPDKIKKIKRTDIINLMKHDKKFISGKNRFVLVEEIGRVKIVEGISIDVINKAIKRYQY